jgi:hypothetical protein
VLRQHKSTHDSRISCAYHPAELITLHHCKAVHGCKRWLAATATQGVAGTTPRTATCSIVRQSHVEMEDPPPNAGLLECCQGKSA